MAGRIRINYIKFIIFVISLAVIIIFGRDVFVRRFFNEQKSEVPNVMNLDVKDAEKYLKEAGLKVKINSSNSEKVGFNKVFIQYPEAGKIVKTNRTVQIWVNNGKGKEVPNIEKMELLEAKSILQNSDIQIEKIDYQPSDAKFNTIISVYPAPGTKLDPNQKISLLVSSRKILDASVMPNLIGLDLNDAQTLLVQLGLKAGKISRANDDTLPVNAIISTNPAPGAKIEKGQAVSIVINSGPAPRKAEPTIEDIIKQNSDENVTNQNVEDIINQTMEKIDEKSTKPANPPANNTAKPDNGSGTAPAGGESQPKQAPQPKKPEGSGTPAPAQD